MQINIEVLSVSVNSVPTSKGSYQVAEVAYKDLKDGKVNGKKIMDFVSKDVFNGIKGAKQGERFSIEIEKEAGRDGKEYWQWKTISAGVAATAVASSTPSTGGSHASPRNTYETPEERAVKQNYIIRQSSISNAITVLKTEKIIPTFDDVAALADKFVEYVYNEGTPELTDDIPF